MFLNAGPSEAGRLRLQEVYKQLVSRQEGATKLANGKADRQLLHRVDINFKDECPAPVIKSARRSHSLVIKADI